jgi:cell division protein FtsL
MARRELSAEKKAERDRLDDEWVQRQLEKAPLLTVRQIQMLRRLKTDLTRKALDSRDRP